MKKLIIGGWIVLLVILTAGFASAKSVCTATACNASGELEFVAADGSTVYTVDAALVLNKIPSSAFWTGTLEITNPPAGFPAGLAVTYDISAIKAAFESDDPHLFYDIAGVDSSGAITIAAEGENNARAPKGKVGFGIHGKIYDSTTFVGSFHGPLLPPK